MISLKSFNLFGKALCCGISGSHVRQKFGLEVSKM
jgi:hypothetical protein